MRTILLILFVLVLANTAAKSQILFGKDWKQGWYYDLEGKKVTGLLYWAPPIQGLFKPKGDHILFKKDKKDDRSQISTDSLKSFVIGADTFVISHFPDFEKKPILQVMIAKQQLKLYFLKTKSQSYTSSGFGANGMHTAPMTYGGGGTNTSYYYGPDPEHVTELTRKTFIDVMSELMADKPEVVKSIKTKYFKFGDIDDLLTYYNTGVKVEYNKSDVY